jgi:hypothetical protein
MEDTRLSNKPGHFVMCGTIEKSTNALAQKTNLVNLRGRLSNVF